MQETNSESPIMTNGSGATSGKQPKQIQAPPKITEPPKVHYNEKKINLSDLRLSQNFSDMVGVKKAVMTVPVRKSNRQEFFRVREGSEWRLETAVLEIKYESETYLVDPSLWSELPGEIIPKVLFTTINRQNVLTLWPVRLPGEDGRLDAYNRSALDIAELATRVWVRIGANKSLGAYEAFQALGDFPEPQWPDLSFQELVDIAFKDNYIKTLDHPVIRKLRGIT